MEYNTVETVSKSDEVMIKLSSLKKVRNSRSLEIPWKMVMAFRRLQSWLMVIGKYVNEYILTK